MSDDRRALVAAAVILASFGLIGFLLPRIILSVAEFSTAIAVLVAVMFVAAFFLVFWLRAKWKERGRH